MRSISKHLAVAAVGTVALFLTAGLARPSMEHWPTPVFDPAWASIIAKEAQNPRTRQFIANPQPYKADGDYLEYASRPVPQNAGNVKVDPQGVPLIKYGEEYYYNPVTVSQFALAAHGRHDTEPMIAAVERLMKMMDGEGALRYPFSYRHYVDTLPLKIGWTSGMAQGQFLSAAGRAYKATGDARYLDAGSRALAFLQRKHPDGPMTTMADLDPSLSAYVFFLEYPSEPNIYTLNGYMFTLLGLYDWSALTGSKEASDLFDRGITTLVRILPYYGLGKITSYDLSHITQPGQPFQVARSPHVAARYHPVHINLLNALHSVTGDPTLGGYAKKWSTY